MIIFKSKQHKLRFAKQMARACKFLNDIRTAAFFYVVTGDDFLYARIDSLYNFYLGLADERVLYSEMQVIPMFSGEWWLLEFAFSLYFETYPVDAQMLFANITEYQMSLVIESAKIRYKQEPVTSV